MALTTLRIQNLRNINSLEVNPGKGVNLIHGKNGSGKTTILESIYLLARAKSFRSSRSGPLISRGSNELTVFGEYQTSVIRHGIGIRKKGSETELRLDGNKVKRTSEIAKILPIQIVTPQSHQILERGPEFRRRFIEWGVFHVEHNYHSNYTRYLRALTQRNAALKNHHNKITPWNRELIIAGQLLNDTRVSYIESLKSLLTLEINNIFPKHEISLEWRQGWDSSLSLEEALDRSYKSDLEKGFTQIGPHRADMVIRMDGQKAINIASRGQQKLIITALKLAQLNTYIDKLHERPVLLIDDLGAELDLDNLAIVTSRLNDLSIQTFITATDRSHFTQGDLDRVFHVEHGRMVNI